MLFRVVSISAIVLALGLGDVPRGALSARDRAALPTVCRHYENRARYEVRGPGAPFVVTLADGCRSARSSYASGNFAERHAAAGFLMRLRRLRDLIIAMNMARVFGDSYTADTRISHRSSTRSEPVRHVSSTGEYLIAHRLGLIAAYHAWLDTAPEIAMALTRER